MYYEGDDSTKSHSGTIAPTLSLWCPSTLNGVCMLTLWAWHAAFIAPHLNGLGHTGNEIPNKVAHNVQPEFIHCWCGTTS